MMEKQTDFHERCLAFSAEILKLSRRLPKSSGTRVILSQLVRSGTSIGANVREARGAESRADFIHKFQIALKEAQETRYWLELVQKAEIFDNPALTVLAQEAKELASILARSVITAKQRNTDQIKN